ncbi:MAG: ferritin-like domain-containing protein [Flavipsychrobacter sp.]|nr:ferritin-like domain-containing protein [Flavipsychrobacter sp.]
MKEVRTQDQIAQETASLSRRKFLNYAGAIAGAGILMASCKKEEDAPVPEEGAIELGSSDTGLLNYAYLLQQLEAAFYTDVLKNPYPGMTNTDKGIFTAIRDHEIVHREVLKNYLGPDAIPTLENDWSSIDFSLKDSVWAKAKFIEEVVVAGLNGICKVITSETHLVYLSKMTVVDARHSATINDLITPGTFAEKTDNDGKEVSQDPHSSLDITRKFFKKAISGIYLPKY